MEIFRGSSNRWFIKTENAKEKKHLFKIIPKRDRMAIYYHPGGKIEQQFSVSAKEADTVSKGWEGV